MIRSGLPPGSTTMAFFVIGSPMIVQLHCKRADGESFADERWGRGRHGRILDIDRHMTFSSGFYFTCRYSTPGQLFDATNQKIVANDIKRINTGAKSPL